MSSHNIKPLSIAIIGTGPSAIYTLQGLARSRVPLHMTLYEEENIAGTGRPYSSLHNSVEMLSNICSLEIPPLGVTFAAWLADQPRHTLKSLGVNAPVDERTYYPRIALGAYFKEQFENTILSMRASGHEVRLRINTRVHDIHPGFGKADVITNNSEVKTETFDCVVIATGHQETPTEFPGVVPNAVLLNVLSDLNFANVGIIGTSLSALDSMVAIAGRFGSFTRDDLGKLRYEMEPDMGSFHLTLMSRHGILPEADFYYPLPLTEPLYFTNLSVDAFIAQGSDGLLERVFKLFLQELELSDPEYFSSLPKPLTVDSFAQAYFKPRLTSDPVVWARRNLVEATENHKLKKVVAWRHTLLRSHEVFGRAVPHLSPADLERFNKGLKTVFVDNYSAVPLLSIERLLALHDCGLLSVLQLGKDYELKKTDAGQYLISNKTGEFQFSALIDARGQRVAELESLPFPTLRLYLLANQHKARAEKDASELEEGDDTLVDDEAKLNAGLNAIDGVYFWALPYLLERRPFIQGLTVCHEIGEGIAAAILRTNRSKHVHDNDAEDELRILIDEMRDDSKPVYVNLSIVKT